MFVHNICCQKFQVTDKMIRLFTNAIYKRDGSLHTEDNPQPSTSFAQTSPASAPTLSDDSEENEVSSFDEILAIEF